MKVAVRPCRSAQLWMMSLMYIILSMISSNRQQFGLDLLLARQTDLVVVVTHGAADTFDQLHHLLAHVGIFIEWRVDVVALAVGTAVPSASR